MLIIKPTQGNATYDKAAKVFQEMYKKITGEHIEIEDSDDMKSDLYLIGSDAVNDIALRDIFDGKLDSLNIRYGTDDYCIRSYKNNDRNIVILAGGRGRSTLYAIYDYFERFADCHYFWDGDVIPHKTDIQITDIDVIEKPHFEYRGLRYFAHRGLKRFQAEHWSLEDWKQELDWMTKKRLNFFMLRIGMDDVWQRAFPEVVSYPKSFQSMNEHGYDDRSDFWNIKYRGKLREDIMEYARLLDLTYPTDCGTMTHWYSRTPVEYLTKVKPAFLDQADQQYIGSDTGRVFDFRKEKEMSAYMHLTDTMVQEYDKQTELFHTIGLGERRMFKEESKNLNLKLFTYRRISEQIHQKYPGSKLMLASWDFNWWKPQDIQKLLDELDSTKTLILDYTSECNDPDDSFLNWGVIGKFPWIFGLFHAYESESELRGPYDRSDERLKIAMEDPFCKGMVLWPELSHSDPMVLEYLTANAWNPLQKNIEKLAEDFCYHRYGQYSEQMNQCWQHMLPFIKLGDWGGYSKRPVTDKDHAKYTPAWYEHQDIWAQFSFFMSREYNSELWPGLKEHVNEKIKKTIELKDNLAETVKILLNMENAFSNPFIKRDAIDIVKTILGRFMNYISIAALQCIGDSDAVLEKEKLYMTALKLMERLLGNSTDYSIYESFLELKNVAPVNPNFETTLKKNICNVYCSQAAYELVGNVFAPEAKNAFEWMKQGGDSAKIPELIDKRQKLTVLFIEKPLEEMRPEHPKNLSEVLQDVYNYIINKGE